MLKEEEEEAEKKHYSPKIKDDLCVDNSLIRYLRGFLVVTLTVLLGGPVPAVLYALTKM